MGDIGNYEQKLSRAIADIASGFGMALPTGDVQNRETANLKNLEAIADAVAFDRTTVTTLTTAGAGTYTAAQLLGGLILRDPNGAGRTDTTATAAQIRTALGGGIAAGYTFDVHVRNTADAAETITVQGGTGVTISGTATIAQNNARTFRFVCTNAATPTFTAYSLGTVVF